jgi:hypothetical protein
MKYNIKIIVPRHITGDETNNIIYTERTDDISITFGKLEYDILKTIEVLKFVESPDFLVKTGNNPFMVREKVKENTVTLKALLYIKETLTNKIKIKTT